MATVANGEAGRFYGRKGDVMQLTLNQRGYENHWLHEVTHLEHEDGRMLLKIYGVRVLALFVATFVWVMFTLASGVFAVAMVMLIGAFVGNAHHLLSSTQKRAHQSSAFLLTVLGGIGANVLAGLALFSSKMGVSYREVLASRRIPEDLPVLLNSFVESFRPEDGLFYLLAAVVAMLSARYFGRKGRSAVLGKR